MPKWNDDEVRAQLKRIEEMCQRDTRAFGADPMVEPRIIEVGTPNRNRDWYTAQALQGFRPSEMASATSIDNIDFSLVNVDHLHQEITHLKDERTVLYKRCQELQQELDTLKDHLHSILTNPVFKRQYK